MTAEYNCPPVCPQCQRAHRDDREETELARLRQQIEQLAYWSRSRTETRITLRDRIAKILTPNL